MTSSDDSKRRERLRYRSWHRGTREMDMLLGGFADAHLPVLAPQQLEQYEALLESGDPDLYKWVTGQEPFPETYAGSVADLLLRHKHLYFG